MILAVSPHLDDVVFSCGGYLLQQSEAFTVVTVFTGSVAKPTGFALACQMDKGLDATVDYMALRRAEDRRAVEILGGRAVHHDHLEAPHRGYESASALFAGPLAQDAGIVDATYRTLAQHVDGQITEVLYPIGAGNHVDHLQVIAAVERLRSANPNIRFRQYYDMPYTRKFPQRSPSTDGAEVLELPAGVMERKVRACAAYTTQLAFQFGGEGRIADVLGSREYLR